MTDPDTQFIPDLDELLQVDEPPAMSTVPVRLVEAGTFWPLPNRRVRIDEQICDDASWVQILDGSKKRSRAFLVTSVNPMRVRVSTSGTGMAWPVAEPYPVTHTQAVFVQCATAGQLSTIGVTEEFWAD
jgi:hypothetical protein